MQISFVQGPAPLPRPVAYRVLVLGPFAPLDGAAANDGEGTGALAVDRGSFAEVLDRLAPQVTLDIPNELTDEGATWWIPLRIRSLVDLTPEGLIRQVPELAWIDRLRQAIVAVGAGVEAPGHLRAQLGDYEGVSALRGVLERCRKAITDASEVQAAPPSPAPPPARQGQTLTSDVDRIFDLVDAPAPANIAPQSPARAAVASVITAVSARSRGPRPIPPLAEAGAQVADLLSRQLQPLFAHPRFRALEAAWRGLHFLLQGIGSDADVVVEILATEADRVVADLQQALGPAAALNGDGAVDLVVMDIGLTSGLTDTERLATLAETAERASVPVLVPLDAGFLAPALTRSLATIQDPARLLDAATFTKWNVLRRAESCRWVGACFNDFVLRLPYRAEDRHSAGIAAAGPVAEAALWGHASWLVARRVVEQFQRTGWPAPIAGGSAGEVHDLMLIAHEDPLVQSAQYPLRHGLSLDQCRDLANAGILSPWCVGNRDSVWIDAAPSLFSVPALANREETIARRSDASLTAQLVRARLVHSIVVALGNLREVGGQARAQALGHYLMELVSGTGPGAHAEVAGGQGRDDAMMISITLGDLVSPGLRVALQIGGPGAV